jgi:hypothetical protein
LSQVACHNSLALQQITMLLNRRSGRNTTPNVRHAWVGFFLSPTLEIQKHVKAGRLQEVLPDWFSKPVQRHALTTSSAQSQRVRCFVEELMAFLRAHTIESSQDS